jgi:hypothetical protein
MRSEAERPIAARLEAAGAIASRLPERDDIAIDFRTISKKVRTIAYGSSEHGRP